MYIILQIDVCELPLLLLSSFCNHDAIKCDNDFIKTSSYKWTKLLYLRIKKGKQKVYVDFNLIWRFHHSEGSKAKIFYSLTETILTSSSSPSSGRMSGLPPFCFFLLFPLELTFVKKQPHQSYSLNLIHSYLYIFDWPNSICLLPMTSFQPLNQGPDLWLLMAWQSSLKLAALLSRPLLLKIFLPLLPSTFSPIVFALNSNEKNQEKKMVTKLDHLLPSKKYSKLTCEVQPHCVLLWHVQTCFLILNFSWFFYFF